MRLVCRGENNSSEAALGFQRMGDVAFWPAGMAKIKKRPAKVKESLALVVERGDLGQIGLPLRAARDRCACGSCQAATSVPWWRP